MDIHTHAHVRAVFAGMMKSRYEPIDDTKKSMNARDSESSVKLTPRFTAARSGTSCVISRKNQFSKNEEEQRQRKVDLKEENSETLYGVVE